MTNFFLASLMLLGAHLGLSKPNLLSTKLGLLAGKILRDFGLPQRCGENCALLGCCPAIGGNSLPTFRVARTGLQSARVEHFATEVRQKCDV